MNRVLIGLSIGAATVVGAAGVGLGYSGTLSLSRQADATVTAGSLTYYLCPNQGVAGELHHGDRVYVTGVDETGEWVQVRAPHHLDDRAWIQRPYVDPDDEFDVPVATCSTEIGQLELAEGPDGATTTTEPDHEPEEVDEPGDDPDEPTATTTPGTPTTVVPTPTQPTPTTAPTTPTTAPTPTTSPPTPTTTIPSPTIGTISRNPSVIIEDYACAGPTTSFISVEIANATSATMSWTVGSSTGSKAMSRSGSTFTAELGPFGEHVVDGPAHLDIDVTITASGPGGSTPRSTTVRLNDCYFG